MAKDSTVDREQLNKGHGTYRVVAADKKVAKKAAKKKAAKKTTKKAAARKKPAADKKVSETRAATRAAPPPPAPPPQPTFVPPAEEPESRGSLRGIVALWGPLAIIVLLIVVSRFGNDEPADLSRLGDQAATGLSSSLESVESAARGVVEDVQDALTGGDPKAVSVLGGVPGQSGSGSTSADLAAAFQETGVAAAPPASKSAATAPDPWAQSEQTTQPASVSAPPSAMPGMMPPNPDNPWAPVGPGMGTGMGTGMSADPYQQAGAMPMPPLPPGHDQSYGQQGYAAPGGGYPAPPPGYPQGYSQGYPQGYPQQGYSQGYYPPQQPQGYGMGPYGNRPPAYPPQQQQAYGAPPQYGAPPAYNYPPPYPPGYYPPTQ